MADDDTGAALAAAAAAKAAEALNLSETEGGNGNPEPKTPPNEPPKVEPTPEEKAAAEKAAADEAAAKAAADAAAEAAPLNHDVWGTTNNDVGDSVLNLMQNAGMTPEDAKSILFDAFQAGDISKVDKAALEAKVGKAKATLILAGTESYMKSSQEANAATIKAVHETAGGEANWKAVTDWAKAGAVTDADLKDYRELIDAGGAKARFAVGELVGRFNADAKNTSITAVPVVVGDGKAAPGGEAITRAEYVTRLAAVHKKGGNPAEEAIIQAARERGRAKGI